MQNNNKLQKPKVTFNAVNNVNQIPVQQIPQMPTSIPVQYQQVYIQQQQQQPIDPNYGLQFQFNQIPQQQLYMPQQFISSNSMPFNLTHHHHHQANKITLLNKIQQDKDKKVVAVIVSFVCNDSYDNLFTSVQQKSQEGTKVLVYTCSSDAIDIIFKEFKGQQTNNQTTKQMIKHIKQLDSDCVVFNWECSSGYGPELFPQGKNTLFSFVKLVIDRGHMVMFSDFSLKALIHQWDSQLLGPNPFKKVGETSNPIDLYFDKNVLIQCPSAQLQIVGQMADGGKCHVQTMGGTIVYSVDKSIHQNQFYKLDILTVAQSDCQVQDKNYSLQIASKVGTAGHILLTYKSGGHLLTSMGHWIQLMKIDTSEHKLFEVAEKQYGVQYAQQMRSQYSQMNVQQQKAYISSNAVNFVQNQAPCQNMMSKKSKY